MVYGIVFTTLHLFHWCSDPHEWAKDSANGQLAESVVCENQEVLPGQLIQVYPGSTWFNKLQVTFLGLSELGYWPQFRTKLMVDHDLFLWIDGILGFGARVV